jgi:hypothetical protein
MRRVVPVRIILIPTNVPITHNEFDGHCLQIIRQLRTKSLQWPPTSPAISRLRQTEQFCGLTVTWSGLSSDKG